MKFTAVTANSYCHVTGSALPTWPFYDLEPQVFTQGGGRKRRWALKEGHEMGWIQGSHSIPRLTALFHDPSLAFRRPSTVQAPLSDTLPQSTPAFWHRSTVQTPLSDTLLRSNPRFPALFHSPGPTFWHPTTVQSPLFGTLPQSRPHFLTPFSHASLAFRHPSHNPSPGFQQASSTGGLMS